jgi:formate dehydrogenase iron-sulfur subunit
MDLDRRNFLKTLGFVGLTFTVGKSIGNAEPDMTDVEFRGILFDSTRCVGCQSCEYACAETYSLPEPEDSPEPGIIRKTNENRRVVVNAFDTTKGEMYMRSACNHCNDPACASACPTKAMLKTDQGPVIWREGKCIGCRSCMISCPFDIPKFEYDNPNPKIQKCRMCYETIQEGGMPACVEACPAEALQFGTRRELIDMARARIYADPDIYNHDIYGEHEVGGTGLLYLSSVSFEEVGCRTDLGTKPYPELNKTFLYSVPAVLIIWPAFLLGLYNSRKGKINNDKLEKGGQS